MNTLRTTTNTSFLSLLLAGLLLLLPGAGFETASVQAGDCTAPGWNQDITYARGDVVTHQVHEWGAKRTSTGVTPGTHKPTWRDLGACVSEPPPDPPPPDPPPPGDTTPIQIFGVWHAGNHYADWAYPREPEEFGEANHWIIDRGDGSGLPSVNLVVLSFLHPMDILRMEPTVPESGVPIGMEQWVVDYFKSAGIRVMMSIGGITYTDAWDEALATDAYQFGLNAAAIATRFGVGI